MNYTPYLALICILFNYFGVRPDQVVDWKALVGDSSDNIPGVRGVGKKTATRLLTEYETLDNLYANVENVKGAMGKKVAEGKTLHRLARNAREGEARWSHGIDT